MVKTSPTLTTFEMASPPQRLPLSAATKIARYQLLPPNGLSIEVAQAEHRIRLINLWDIAPGSQVLEIGCGQGNCTAVLAEAVGPDGHIDAVDPAPSDYGAPFTLAQAQTHVSASDIGSRVTWHRAQPEEFVKSGSKEWDVAVLAHCIWYFKNPGVLESILEALRGRVERVCIAEYALHATEKAAVPHVLAALARGTLEAHKAQSSQNIQTPLSPAGIKEVANGIGWTVKHEGVVVPEQGLQDGYWEAGTIASHGFLKEIEDEIEDGRVKTVLQSARQSVVAAADAIGGVKSVRTMDVWAGVLTLLL